MSLVAPQLPQRASGSEDNVAVGFPNLPSGVLLTGTPTVVEVGGSDLTLTAKQVNTAAVTIDGTSYAAGQAVQFHRAGGTAGTTYTIKITVSTDQSPDDVVVGYVKVRIVRDDAV